MSAYSEASNAMLRGREIELLRDALSYSKIGKTARDYAALLERFSDSSAAGRNKFENLFSQYYGLRSAGLTPDWFRRYFELLFGFSKTKHPEPYRYILLELYGIPRWKGDKALQFSFVSKLVAFHDERKPLYDKYVREFFGLGPPDFGPPEFRILGFIENLNEIARRYESWVEEKEFSDLLDTFRDRHPELSTVHPHRLFDFLVHAAGKQWSEAN